MIRSAVKAEGQFAWTPPTDCLKCGYSVVYLTPSPDIGNVSVMRCSNNGTICENARWPWIQRGLAATRVSPALLLLYRQRDVLWAAHSEQIRVMEEQYTHFILFSERQRSLQDRRERIAVLDEAYMKRLNDIDQRILLELKSC